MSPNTRRSGRAKSVVACTSSVWFNRGGRFVRPPLNSVCEAAACYVPAGRRF
jgi:hypothetical protein